MNRQKLRSEAASLARECRSIERQGIWTIKEWNDSVRKTVRNYMKGIEAYCREINTWEEA